MAKRDYIDFQSRTQPLGYLITFRTYGTWLHGEDRGSVDRRRYNRYGKLWKPQFEKYVNNVDTSFMLLTRAQTTCIQSLPLHANLNTS